MQEHAISSPRLAGCASGGAGLSAWMLYLVMVRQMLLHGSKIQGNDTEDSRSTLSSHLLDREFALEYYCFRLSPNSSGRLLIRRPSMMKLDDM